jgi:hypothetical protein
MIRYKPIYFKYSFNYRLLVFWLITDEIQCALEQLPYAEEVVDLIDSGNYDDVVSFAIHTMKNVASKTTALWACWQGRRSLLEKLLKLGLDPNTADEAGRYGKNIIINRYYKS